MPNNTHNTPCGFAQVSREMIVETRNNIKEIKESIDQLNDKVTDLFNHQSNRLPLWATAVGCFLSAICTGLLIWAITR